MLKTILQLKGQNTSSKLVFDVPAGLTNREYHLVVRNELEGALDTELSVLIGDGLPAVFTMQATFLYRLIYSKFTSSIVSKCCRLFMKKPSIFCLNT
ncbi:MAG: hypothetical protein KAV45_15050 [Calditrichia bacterium]|nr:hypothetical protein [Calditrichia bacterium]